MTRIKVCGLTREEDVEAAIGYGADMLGFIYVKQSPRFLAQDRIKRLLDCVGGRAETVVVVQDSEPAELDLLRENLDFDLIQFHGSEPPEFIRRWRGYKVIHLHYQLPDQAEIDRYDSPFLLDTRVGNRSGGTGITFDWTLLDHIRGDYLVAGGLEVGNIIELIHRYKPYGVDISSGVESEPGKKDHEKLKQFIENVRRPDTA